MDDPVPPGEESKAAYAVATTPQPGPPGSRYALFFTHGMGQSIPFQTIDQVANSLRALDLEQKHNNPKPVGRTIKSGEDWLNRIELRLKSDEDAVEVHLYEGYWAPMTEGRIKAHNVISFLAGAGFNGLRHTKGKFRRWLFGNFPELPIPARTVMFLLAALATVASLVIMNSAIAIVAAARALLGQKPAWLSDNLFVDLTTTFNVVVTVMAVFGLSLALAALMRKLRWPQRIRQWWSVVTLVLFVVALFVVSLAGLAIPFLFYGHVRGLAGVWPLWYKVVHPDFVDRFNQVFDAFAWWAALALALIVAGRWLWRILKGLKRDLEDKDRAPLTLAVAIVFFALLGSLVAVAVFFVRTFVANDPDGAASVRHAIAWPLLVAASAYVRVVLVQYLGDVAIYVMPYKLDAFNDLRREIKLRVYNAAKAVYAHKKPYDRIIVVGHSLGSVIAYDALNMLILEDESPRDPIAKESPGGGKDALPKDPLDVVRRTPLFLTFGSPLDKTAFVFAAQARGTSEAREALAGSVQPLIVDYRFRPKRWINFWSPWDIISGPLDLYDQPISMHDSAGTLRQRVCNVRDEEATTLLIAHVEYWKNPMLVKTIYDEIKAL